MSDYMGVRVTESSIIIPFLQHSTRFYNHLLSLSLSKGVRFFRRPNWQFILSIFIYLYIFILYVYFSLIYFVCLYVYEYMYHSTILEIVRNWIWSSEVQINLVSWETVTFDKTFSTRVNTDTPLLSFDRRERKEKKSKGFCYSLGSEDSYQSLM